MWLYVTYEPVAAFGLRPSNTTSNGGKSLLGPTPYAIKMALLDRIIRHAGLETGESLFPTLRDLPVYLQLPLCAAVNRTFQKVLRTYDSKTREWVSTIAQREFVFFAGPMTLAVPAPDDPTVTDWLLIGFTAINSYGRRGSFFQFVEHMLHPDPPDPAAGFVNASQPASGTPFGYLQRMDDMESDATFSNVSTLNPKATGARRSYTVTFPYQLDYHGMNHTIYRRNRSAG